MSNCLLFDEEIADIHCRDVYYPPHTHEYKTIYLVLSGSIHFVFPGYKPNQPTVRVPLQLGGSTSAVTTSANHLASKRLRVGECVEMEADTEHEATVGGEGCIFVVGEMK